MFMEVLPPKWARVALLVIVKKCDPIKNFVQKWSQKQVCGLMESFNRERFVRPNEHQRYKISLFCALISKKTLFSVVNFLCFGHRHTVTSPLSIFTQDISWPPIEGFAFRTAQFLRRVSADSESTVCSTTKFRFIFPPNEGSLLR